MQSEPSGTVVPPTLARPLRSVIRTVPVHGAAAGMLVTSPRSRQRYGARRSRLGLAVTVRVLARGSTAAGGSATYLVSCTIADIWSIAVANAITSSGRAGNAAIIGQGASLDGVKAIRAGGPIVASTWFDAGRYGDYIVPMAVDILKGQAVPLEVHQKLLIVDKGNANKFYKGQ